MGVDFYPCSRCNNVYCDCGEYVMCECGRDWCSDKCAENDGHKVIGYCEIQNIECDDYSEDEFCCGRGDCKYYAEEESCSYCRQEVYEDEEILEFVLRSINKSKDQIIEEMNNKH